MGKSRREFKEEIQVQDKRKTARGERQTTEAARNESLESGEGVSNGGLHIINKAALSRR